MITFDTAAGRFNYRVAGVCIHADHVLLSQAARDDFWAMPGGRVELLEDSRSTLMREMRKELGVEVTCDRLLWVLENFFTYEDRAFHELALYYAMTLPAASPLLNVGREFPGLEAHDPMVFRWFPVEQLTQVRLYPTILRTELQQVPATTRHLIHTDFPDDEAK